MNYSYSIFWQLKQSPDSDSNYLQLDRLPATKKKDTYPQLTLFNRRNL